LHKTKKILKLVKDDDIMSEAFNALESMSQDKRIIDILNKDQIEKQKVTF